MAKEERYSIMEREKEIDLEEQSRYNTSKLWIANPFRKGDYFIVGVADTSIYISKKALRVFIPRLRKWMNDAYGKLNEPSKRR